MQLVLLYKQTVILDVAYKRQNSWGYASQLGHGSKGSAELRTASFLLSSHLGNKPLI